MTESSPFPMRVLRAPLTPVVAWLASFGVFTGLSVDHLLGGLSPAILQLPAKIGAYVTAATTAALGVGLAVAFGLSCGATLRWLEGTVDARAVARSVCAGIWAFAAYTSAVAGAWLAHPPERLTHGDLVAMAAVTPSAAAWSPVPWLDELQYAAGAAFLLVVFLLLARVAERLNAAIAVAAATSVVALLATGLRVLAGLLPV